MRRSPVVFDGHSVVGIDPPPCGVRHGSLRAQMTRSLTSLCLRFNFPTIRPPSSPGGLAWRLAIQFGKRLVQLCRRAGLTQEQLADGVGVTVESISNMERGIFGPRFDHLERIARVLKVSVKSLFEFGKE